MVTMFRRAEGERVRRHSRPFLPGRSVPTAERRRAFWIVEAVHVHHSLADVTGSASRSGLPFVSLRTHNKVSSCWCDHLWKARSPGVPEVPSGTTERSHPPHSPSAMTSSERAELEHVTVRAHASTVARRLAAEASAAFTAARCSTNIDGWPRFSLPVSAGGPRRLANGVGRCRRRRSPTWVMAQRQRLVRLLCPG
jgi:hypothetical protein